MQEMGSIIRRKIKRMDCFYKVKITKGKKIDICHWGYFPYKMVMDDVKQLYKDGADAVELEMITKDQFDKMIEPYTNPEKYTKKRK